MVPGDFENEILMITLKMITSALKKRRKPSEKRVALTATDAARRTSKREPSAHRQTANWQIERVDRKD